MIPVYRAGWQLTKLRAVMLVSLIGSALFIWWGLDLAQTYGLNPGDGGVLAPLPQRLAVGSLVASLGIAAAIGMWLYGRHYAARIDLDPVKKQIRVVTVGFFWNDYHLIKVADLGCARSHGEINWGVVAVAAATGHFIPLVDAPWKSVRIAGWRWPLILDQQGETHHFAIMQMLFGK